MITQYPVSTKKFTKEEAPYVYTMRMEEYAKIRPHLEPRTAGTIACFGGEPLQDGITAKAWLHAGYITTR